MAISMLFAVIDARNVSTIKMSHTKVSKCVYSPVLTNHNYSLFKYARVKTVQLLNK